jgi:hypothetical protein
VRENDSQLSRSEIDKVDRLRLVPDGVFNSKLVAFACKKKVSGGCAGPGECGRNAAIKRRDFVFGPKFQGRKQEGDCDRKCRNSHLFPNRITKADLWFLLSFSTATA